ncbi:hypothetical protein JYK00_03400 [Thermosipho ferrireducens]|uniref:Uncharacterized protein n=1 Tax=Thermosipho ferrireducens TaxID=2571116 RepID=A0ABX7S7L7_9BACT|nr:hypothetical protein [Thermosipho ferrireducens]QTA38572.1 hypothetical protein JYK00_03400 [Thermosipho ferrireducens]
MNLKELKEELSVKCKNGVAFLSSAVVVWAVMLMILVSKFTLETKNSLILWSTALLFPLAMAFSKLFKAQWKVDSNPLSILGFYLNIAQLVYYPIVVWAMIRRPEEMIIFLGIITSAHLFPYGWYYNTKVYMIMSIFMSVSILLIGLRTDVETLWIIPLFMISFLVILVVLLYKDYMRKERISKS